MATHEQSGISEFGKMPVQVYVPRPGAYCLIFDSQGRIAVMQTPRGCFLPGGGTEGKESPEETRVGEAAEYRDTPGHKFAIRKDCVFFTGNRGKPLALGFYWL